MILKDEQECMRLRSSWRYKAQLVKWTNLPITWLPLNPKKKKCWVDNCLVHFPKGCAKVKYLHRYQGWKKKTSCKQTVQSEPENYRGDDVSIIRSPSWFNHIDGYVSLGSLYMWSPPLVHEQADFVCWLIVPKCQILPSGQIFFTKHPHTCINTHTHTDAAHRGT